MKIGGGYKDVMFIKMGLATAATAAVIVYKDKFQEIQSVKMMKIRTEDKDVMFKSRWGWQLVPHGASWPCLRCPCKLTWTGTESCNINAIGNLAPYKLYVKAHLSLQINLDQKHNHINYM